MELNKPWLCSSRRSFSSRLIQCLLIDWGFTSVIGSSTTKDSDPLDGNAYDLSVPVFHIELVLNPFQPRSTEIMID